MKLLLTSRRSARPVEASSMRFSGARYSERSRERRCTSSRSGK